MRNSGNDDRGDEFDWEASAMPSMQNTANEEFKRLQHSLKVKAGLIKLPIHIRVLNWVKKLLGHGSH